MCPAAPRMSWLRNTTLLVGVSSAWRTQSSLRRLRKLVCAAPHPGHNRGLSLPLGRSCRAGVWALRFVAMPQLTDTTLPTSADVDAAAVRLAGVALRTPLVTSPVLDA